MLLSSSCSSYMKSLHWNLVKIISFCPRLSTFYHEQRKFLNTFRWFMLEEHFLLSLPPFKISLNFPIFPTSWTLNVKLFIPFSFFSFSFHLISKKEVKLVLSNSFRLRLVGWHIIKINRPQMWECFVLTEIADLCRKLFSLSGTQFPLIAMKTK